MKKYALLLALVALFAATAHAATTGNITISGSVAQQTNITVTPLTGYNNLDLSTTASDLAVADVKEQNNTNLGYKVTLTSQNAGALKNGTLGSMAYSAKYNGSSVSLSSTPVTVTTGPVVTSPVNVTKQFKVSYTGIDPATVMQGTYSDTLTFTISSP